MEWNFKYMKKEVKIKMCIRNRQGALYEGEITLGRRKKGQSRKVCAKTSLYNMSSQKVVLVY